MAHRKHCIDSMALGFTIILSILAIGNYRPTYSQTPSEDEAWRYSLNAFANEVSAVLARSTIPNAAEEVKRTRQKVVFNNSKGEGIWVIFGEVFGSEFHGAVPSHFQGKVTWRGIVDSVEQDAAEKTYVIEVKFPMPAKTPKTLGFRLSLSVPFEKLATREVPMKGSEFAFSGTLRKPLTLPGGSVWYGLGPNKGKMLVNVLLDDIEPMKGK